MNQEKSPGPRGESFSVMRSGPTALYPPRPWRRRGGCENNTSKEWAFGSSQLTLRTTRSRVVPTTGIFETPPVPPARRTSTNSNHGSRRHDAGETKLPSARFRAHSQPSPSGGTPSPTFFWVDRGREKTFFFFFFSREGPPRPRREDGVTCLGPSTVLPLPESVFAILLLRV